MIRTLASLLLGAAGPHQARRRTEDVGEQPSRPAQRHRDGVTMVSVVAILLLSAATPSCNSKRAYNAG
jgi:hypothetical protein